VGAVLDRLHAGVVGGFDVFEFVVEEEDVEGRLGEALGGVPVDGGVGLGGVEAVGPGAVIEVIEPGVFAADTKFHGIGHVGKDAGGYAGAMEALGPLGHGEVEVGPEVGVGIEERVEILGGERGEAGFGSDELPICRTGEIATIVSVAMLPVALVEADFFEVRDGAQAGPGGGVGRAGENHAVVEEEGADGRGEVGFGHGGIGRL